MHLQFNKCCNIIEIRNIFYQSKKVLVNLALIIMLMFYIAKIWKKEAKWKKYLLLLFLK